MDKNEDYNFESLSGASNLEEVLYDLGKLEFRFGELFGEFNSVKGAVSRGFRCVRSILYQNHYLEALIDNWFIL